MTRKRAKDTPASTVTFTTTVCSTEAATTYTSRTVPTAIYALTEATPATSTTGTAATCTPSGATTPARATVSALNGPSSPFPCPSPVSLADATAAILARQAEVFADGAKDASTSTTFAAPGAATTTAVAVGTLAETTPRRREGVVRTNETFFAAGPTAPIVFIGAFPCASPAASLVPSSGNSLVRRTFTPCPNVPIFFVTDAFLGRLMTCEENALALTSRGTQASPTALGYTSPTGSLIKESEKSGTPTDTFRVGPTAPLGLEGATPYKDAVNAEISSFLFESIALTAATITAFGQATSVTCLATDGCDGQSPTTPSATFSEAHVTTLCPITFSAEGLFVAVPARRSLSGRQAAATFAFCVSRGTALAPASPLTVSHGTLTTATYAVPASGILRAEIGTAVASTTALTGAPICGSSTFSTTGGTKDRTACTLKESPLFKTGFLA